MTKLSNVPATTANVIKTKTLGILRTSLSAFPESSGLESEGSCKKQTKFIN